LLRKKRGNKMEKYKASLYTENNIQLENSEQLDKLYETVQADENFILQWIEKEVLKSEVIIATNISSKVKNGELKLTSKQNKTEE